MKRTPEEFRLKFDSQEKSFISTLEGVIFPPGIFSSKPVFADFIRADYVRADFIRQNLRMGGVSRSLRSVGEG